MKVPAALSAPPTLGTDRTPARTLLIYAQDNRGLGHINRTLTIADHLLAAHPLLVAYIVTKSPITGGFALHERCDYIKLPTRLTPGSIRRTDDEEEAERRRSRDLRSRILRDAAGGLAPDLVLVDHEPLGSKGEFRDGLYALKAQHSATRFVFGMRDIMDDPRRIRASWHELGVYDALENLYDGIAVYGSPDLYDVAEAYAIPAAARSKLHYCGYIVRQPPAVDPALVRQKHGLPRSGPLILATVGGGSDGYPVLAASREAADLLRRRFTELSMILVTGPFMSARELTLLEAQAAAHCRVSREADTFQLMMAADAIVSMGGYNSVCEALVAARPLVIVPRATHKIEQKIRAEVLAARGLARWVHPKHLDGRHLAAALEWALGRDRRSHERAVREIIPSFDGAAHLTTYLSRWLGSP